MFARSICTAILIGSIAVVPAGAWAGPTSPPAAATPAPEHAHDGGIIAGKITNVDYQRGIIAVNKTDITVMPSTQIQGSDAAYHAITDLKPGMVVHVYTSLIAGKYIAQIITLK